MTFLHIIFAVALLSTFKTTCPFFENWITAAHPQRLTPISPPLGNSLGIIRKTMPLSSVRAYDRIEYRPQESEAVSSLAPVAPVGQIHQKGQLGQIMGPDPRGALEAQVIRRRRSRKDLKKAVTIRQMQDKEGLNRTLHLEDRGLVAESW